MKKTIIPLLIGSFAMVGVSVGAVISSKNFLANKLRADEKIPGSITIGQGGNPITNLNGANTFTSSNGNPFAFNCINLYEDEGAYAFSGPSSYIENVKELHGISSVEFYTPKGKGDIALDYGFDSAHEDYVEFSIDSDYYVYSFDLTKPTYIYIRPTSDSLSFNKIIINYSCSEGQKIKQYSYLNQTEWNGYSAGMTNNYIAAETDSNLSSIPLSSLQAKGISLSDSGVTNVSISYTSEEDKLSTTVLDGVHNANVEFDYDGYHYINESPIQIVGYSSFSDQESYGYLFPSDVRKQLSNDIPEGMTVSCNVRIELFDENDNGIFYFGINLNGQELIESIIVSSDSNRFTEIGHHFMTINCGGFNVYVQYDVYDPEYNNIKAIGYAGELTIPAGTTTADFLTYILDETNYVVYYEDDEELPHSITLSADNFVLTPGMFDEYTPAAIPVTIRYGNYEGTIPVTLTAVAGNVIATYTTEDPVFFLYSDVIGKVELCDNGLCKTYADKDDTEYNVIYGYTLTGNLLCIDTVVMGVFRLTVNNVNDTFVRYETDASIDYELVVDFSGIGAPSDFYFDGIIYDDGYMRLTYTSYYDLEVVYTVDAVDNDVIYFCFMGYNCVGTIDSANNKLIVTGNPI